jgi:pimeloyl-ACP methyl ester carboxylesterase
VRFFITDGVYYQYNIKKKLPWVRIIEIAFTLILVLLFISLAYQMIATKVDENRYKMKGKMVDIGGYRLFTNTTGEGKVTVVFESDIGNPIQLWNKIKDPLSKSAKIFTYDRAGFGWSDKGTSPTDIAKEARELRALLKKSAAKSPFLLVGHGYGGLVMTKFAEQYPTEVAGLILINSLTDEQVKSSEFKEKISKELLKAQFMKYSSYFGVVRLGYNFEFFKEDSDLLKGLTEEYSTLYKAHKSTAKYNRAYFEELKGLEKYSDKINIDGILGDKPVYIVTSEESNLAAGKSAKWLENQKELLKLSSKSELISIKDSSTYVYVDKPEEIINILSTLIKKVTK